MTEKPCDPDSQIDELLSDPAWDGHPLREALAALAERHRRLLRQLDRLMYIADRYQDAERERGLSYVERYEQQLHRLDRLLRISDRYQKIMQNLHEELRQQSIHDSLTGLYNRRFMRKRLEEEVAKLDRHPDQCFALILGDIDHFKAVNDGFGHDVGDAVLAEVARSLLSHLRQYDVCARWGGEEFLFLLPSTSHEQAYAVCEHLRQTLASTPCLAPGRQAVTVSMSFGFSECFAGQNLDRVLNVADQALYAAKRAGRNCVRPLR